VVVGGRDGCDDREDSFVYLESNGVCGVESVV
jgi:hypothetical protein